MVKKVYVVGFCLLFLAIGFATGRLADLGIIKDTQSATGGQPIRQSGSKYTSPLLDCEYNQSAGAIEYKPSKSRIQDFIDAAKKSGRILDAAVYYRDLNNGPWFGINEKDPFSPASLLKLPVMMAYFKQAETEPGILDKKLTYKKVNGLVEQQFSPKSYLTEGQQYSVEKLIEQMIDSSDNNALFILQDNIANALIDKITEDLGIETANDNTPEDYMSVRSYASLYRVLYNSSYLSRDYSEKALGVLARSNFSKGLVQNLPRNITVANKFGERELDNGIKQLHDCGIIYYPKHPYILCIMTRGKDYDQLSRAIADISKDIYTDIDSRYSK